MSPDQAQVRKSGAPAALAIVLVLAVVGCIHAGSSTLYSVRVVNGTDSVVSRLRLVIGEKQITLGDLAPRVGATAVFAIPEETASVGVAWISPEGAQRGDVSFQSVPPGYRGTVVLTIVTSGELQMQLEDFIAVSSGTP